MDVFVEISSGSAPENQDRGRISVHRFERPLREHPAAAFTFGRRHKGRVRDCRRLGYNPDVGSLRLYFWTGGSRLSENGNV
jgi:hypothetical protein